MQNRPAHYLLSRRVPTRGFLSAYGETNDVEYHKYWVSTDGFVWKKDDMVPLYWGPKDDYAESNVLTVSYTAVLESKKLVYFFDQKSAIAAARKQLEGASAPTLPAKLVGKTWNDGSYTYEVRSPTKAFVPETGVTFEAPSTPTKDKWERFVKQLTAASLKEGKATGKPKSSGGGGGGGKPKSSGGGAVAPSTVSTTPLLGPKENITDKAWFWPVAILVPMTVVVGGILLWPSKKASAAASA